MISFGNFIGYDVPDKLLINHENRVANFESTFFIPY